jgi:hypothetical protein
MSDELVKQPTESRIYSFDFTHLLDSAETISTISSIEQVNLGKVSGSTDLTLGSSAISDKYIQVRISEGTDKENYRLTAIITTSSSNILEMEGILRVRNLL